MGITPFSVHVSHTANGVILNLHGEVNGQADPALNAAYAEALTHQSAAVLLNFSDVNYINSTGIALIVGLLAQARQAQRQISVYGLSEHYLEIFQITRLTDFMHVFPDERSALLALA